MRGGPVARLAVCIVACVASAPAPVAADWHVHPHHAHGEAGGNAPPAVVALGPVVPTPAGGAEKLVAVADERVAAAASAETAAVPAAEPAEEASPSAAAPSGGAEAPLPRPRIAHCVSGQVRSLHVTHRSIGGVLARDFGRAAGDERANADVFVYVDENCFPWKCRTDRLEGWMRDMGVTAWERFPQAYRHSRDVVPENSCERAPTRRLPLDLSFYHQALKAERCYALVRAHEQKMGFTYDWVVRSRTDSAWDAVNFPADALDPGRIYAVDGCNVMEHGAMCDWFFAVPRKWADVAFSATAGWDDCVPDGGDKGFPCHVGSWHAVDGTPPECLLTRHMIKGGVPRDAFVNIRARGSNERGVVMHSASVQHDPGNENVTAMDRF